MIPQILEDMVKKNTLFCFFYFFILQVLAIPVTNDVSEETTKKKHPSEIVKTNVFEKWNKNTQADIITDLLNFNEQNVISWKNLENNYAFSDSIATARALAKNSFTIIEDSGSWVDNFTNEDIQELPVGVKHTRENIEYAIGFTRATFTKDYTELTVFARVRLPQTDSNGYPIELFFGADNVRLSQQGGIRGDAKLVLLGDIHIPFNAGKWMLTLKGGFNYRKGNTQNLTYATINCDGVKEIGIQGEVEFSRELILPIEPDGKVDETKTMTNAIIETENGRQTIQVPYRVKGGFHVIATNWNDLLVDIDLQPFVLTKKRNNTDYNGNFQFAVNQAVLDFSDLRNDPAVVFPTYYKENGLLLQNKSAWRGVYINTVEVGLPREFKTSETIGQGNERVAFGAHHLIVDNYGVSGTFYGDNVFGLDEGRTSNSKAWAYSLDHIEVSLAANNFIGAGFKGRILLPVSKKKPPTNNSSERVGLRYQGLISQEEYLLNVSNDSVVDFNLWKAQGQLLPNSSIELAVKEGQFRPKATLHGRLAITANQVNSLEREGNQIASNESDKKENTQKKKLIEFKGIVFQNLVLQTESPVCSVDYMGYQDEVKLANFPVSISNIGITANETNANLYFDLAINLMGENNGFAAETSLGIIGAFQEEDYRQKWDFQGIDLNAIAINADLGAFSIWGGLELMNDHPTYGDGFAANLGAKFDVLKTEINVNAIFGNKDFRYWMIDALVDLPPGVGSGLVNISGFAGGASYHMRRQEFGASLNGDAFKYQPDKDTGLGVKAMVLLNVIDDSVLKGGAGFEILFNKKGGVNQLGIYGQGAMLNLQIPGLDSMTAALNKFNQDATAKAEFMGYNEEKVESSFVGKHLLEKSDTQMLKVPHGEIMGITAKMGITLDFQNDVLHGMMETFVNTPGGFIKGRGENGRSGWAVLHISKQDWYLYLGTPEDSQGFSVGIGPLSVKSGGYLMTGSILPNAPPPPQEVASILRVKNEELDYMRDENALQRGKGFAFGQNFSIDTGDLRFLVFYARFQAGAGFDIMLRDYGEAQCSNTGDQVGVNGWYANGQAYAYLQGELGIRVKLFFIKKKIPIIHGAAAVLLQAKAPNPIWMRGYVAGEFNVLGGLVKGHFRFKLTIGEECIFEDASPLGGIKIIADVTPKDGTNDIDVFAIPQATFNMKVGEPLIIPEDDGDKTYRIDLEKFVVSHNGKAIPGKLEWSTYKDRVNFISSDILPPQEQLTVQVEVSFKEKINGIFQPIKVDGQLAKELEERTFKTGGAPNYIPLHNITYAYPVVDQKYFLEDEYHQGYVQLKRGQDYLFENDVWESYLEYDTELGESLGEIAFNYHTSNNKITYNLPDIDQQTKYVMKIASKLKGSRGTGTSSATRNQETKSGNTTNGNTVTVENREAENLSKDSEIERLSYNFGTSKYKTFERKVNSISTSNYNWGKIYSDVIYLTNRISNHEPFDLVELVGTEFTEHKALVSIEASLDDDYFTKDLNPPLYSKYPLGGKYIVNNRDAAILGVPPKYDLPILSEYITNLEHDIKQDMVKTTFPYRYNLGLAYKADWVNIRSQIVNDQIEGLSSNSPVLTFLDASYVFMRYGYYRTTLTYKMPGDITGTNTTYKFKNPNNFR